MEQQAKHASQIYNDAPYTTTIMDRLVEQYLARTALPVPEGGVLTIERFHRLYQCVLAEGYGR